MSLVNFVLKYKWLALVLTLGFYQFSSGVYIFLKAEFAQYLIAKAWDNNLVSQEQKPPWPWADTYPVAELLFQDTSYYVLAGASPRNLAFAPAHVSATPLPGNGGNSVIVGHRDTQFNKLKYLQKGDMIEVKTANNRETYKVQSLRIAHQSQVEYLYSDSEDSDQSNSHSGLTLITCYPFDSLKPNPTYRYIVKALAI
ncbi:class GN sortase [Paraglaciecola sp.]|uniref:class GN sortase n=1 Tax=Paraglaciecola sp. TaxID=1920173 RepID=UPI003EF574DE